MTQALQITHTSENNLVAYAFLATLNNNSQDLFQGVYIPICLKALSEYSRWQRQIGSSGTFQGKDTDIQRLVYELYGLNIPQLIVRRMLASIATTWSKNERQKHGFNYQKGKFSIGEYAFVDYDEMYDNQRFIADKIEESFKVFLEREGAQLSTELCSFSKFLDLNKKILSSYFADNARPVEFEIKEYEYHVRYLELIRQKDPSAYRGMQDLYLGSVIASYLESEIDVASESQNTPNVVYYLDTAFILCALDLQISEETLPARELIDIIHQSGATIAVLDITIDEIEGILKKAVENFSNPISYVAHRGDVAYACHRRHLDKTWLENLMYNLEHRIEQDLKAKIETVPEAIKNKAEQSEDCSQLTQERQNGNSNNAFHDVVAYYYVRHKRNGGVSMFRKAHYWFVSPNDRLYFFNRERIGNGKITEIITPEGLASRLWLVKPKELNSIAANLRLHEILAQTVIAHLPTKEMLLEFDKALRLHSNDNVEEYARLLSRLANASAEAIMTLNESAKAGDEALTLALEKVFREQTQEQERQKIIANEEYKQLRADLDSIRSLMEKNREMENLRSQWFLHIQQDYETRSKLMEKELLELRASDIPTAETGDEIKNKSKGVGESGWRFMAAVLGIGLFGTLTYINWTNSTLQTLWGSISAFLLLISSLGGVWSFCNLALNGWKLLWKERKSSKK